ncbi:MAG: HDIG domain-containing metalloprotein [Atribacterota bacterium]
MERNEAWEFLRRHLRAPNLVKHSLACEAIMRALALFFGENEKEWGLAGLLHDIDYEETKDHPEQHGLLGAQYLEEAGFPFCIVSAVRSHNEMTGFKPQLKMEIALFAVDPASGFIVACALVHRERKLGKLDLPFLLSRFKEKSFARGASRDQIKACTQLELPLEDFLSISLQAMQKIAQDLGL